MLALSTINGDMLILRFQWQKISQIRAKACEHEPQLVSWERGWTSHQHLRHPSCQLSQIQSAFLCRSVPVDKTDDDGVDLMPVRIEDVAEGRASFCRSENCGITNLLSCPPGLAFSKALRGTAESDVACLLWANAGQRLAKEVRHHSKRDTLTRCWFYVGSKSHVCWQSLAQNVSN